MDISSISSISSNSGVYQAPKVQQQEQKTVVPETSKPPVDLPKPFVAEGNLGKNVDIRVG